MAIMAKRTDDPNGQLYVELYATVFAHALQASGRTPAGLAAAVGCQPSYVYAISKAGRLPSVEMTREFDRKLAAGGLLNDVRRLIERLETASKQSRTLGGNVDFGKEEGDLERRTLLGMLSGLAISGKLAAELEDQRRLLDAAFVSEPTGRDADEWERVALDYASEVGYVPSGRLLPDLLSDFAEIQVRIDQSVGVVKMRLLHVAGQFAALTAIALTNAGEGRSARRWWRTASRAADGSGDPRLASLIRGRRAVFSLYSPRPMLAVIDIADEALELGSGMACAGVVSGYAARAQALACIGRHEEATQVTRQLADVYERLPDETSGDRTSQWGWSEQRLRHVESFVYSEAGDIERAGEAQDAAIALYPSRSYQGRTQVELYRASCLIRAGDVRSGAEHTVSVLQGLTADRRMDDLILRTAHATLSIIPPKEAKAPAVREARELLAITSGDS